MHQVFKEADPSHVQLAANEFVDEITTLCLQAEKDTLNPAIRKEFAKAVHTKLAQIQELSKKYNGFEKFELMLKEALTKLEPEEV